MGCIYIETGFENFVSKLLVTQIIFLSCLRYYDQGSILVRVYYFQIWNKKEYNMINSRVIVI